QVLRAYIFCGACGNNRTNRGGFQFAAARLPWFTLVPWRPIIDRQLGREVMGIVQGGSVSWQLGRQRGLER
ncbi:DUF3363 domain-containing protein, partial [Escherichia coli]